MTEPDQPTNKPSPEAEAAHALAEQILAIAPPEHPNPTGVVVAALARVLATVWAQVAIQHGGAPDAAACMVYRHANTIADGAARMVAHHYNAVHAQQQHDSLEPKGTLQ